VNSKPGSWLQGILSNWTNPVFCPPQRRISRLSTCRAPDVGQPANTDRQPAFTEKRRREVGEVGQIQTYKLSRAALEHAKAIAQFDGKFILVKVAASPASTGSASSDSDKSEILVIVDQHAADERCRIEDLLAELCTPAAAGADVETDDGCPSTRKLHSRIKTTTLERPIDFTVTEREAQLYHASAAYFARWGLLYDVREREPEPPPPPPAEARQQPAAAEMRVVCVKTIPPGIAERCKAEPHLLLELLRGEIWRREDEEEEGGLLVNQRRPPRVGEAALPSRLSGATAVAAEEAAAPAGRPAGNHRWLGQLQDCPRAMLDLLNSRACRSEPFPFPSFYFYLLSSIIVCCVTRRGEN
jgi:DNA mismatch repair protein MLH3